MGDIALEVPLRLFAIGRRAQGDNPANPRIQDFGNPLDGAAFARCVAAFKQHHNAQAFMANPLLQLDQFNLEAAQFAIVIAVFAKAKWGVIGSRAWNRMRIASRFGFPFAFLFLAVLAGHQIFPG